MRKRPLPNPPHQGEESDRLPSIGEFDIGRRVLQRRVIAADDGLAVEDGRHAFRLVACHRNIGARDMRDRVVGVDAGRMRPLAVAWSSGPK